MKSQLNAFGKFQNKGKSLKNTRTESSLGVTILKDWRKRKNAGRILFSNFSTECL